MKQVLSLSVILLGIVLFSVQCSSKEDALHKKLQNMASNINKSAPVDLDEHTQFDSAGVSADNVFHYYYTIKNAEDPQALIANMKHSLSDNLITAFATNPDLSIFKENNLTIIYAYRDESGNLLETLKVTPDNYK